MRPEKWSSHATTNHFLNVTFEPSSPPKASPIAKCLLAVRSFGIFCRTLGYFQWVAIPCFFWRFLAIIALFGIFFPNTAPTGMQAAFRGERFVGAKSHG
jgi:hypothetical protein